MNTVENEVLNINIDNYSGPLDVLLELAKTQKVDLANISITQLVDQFISFIDLSYELWSFRGWYQWLDSCTLSLETTENEQHCDSGSIQQVMINYYYCLLYTSPSPRD